MDTLLKSRISYVLCTCNRYSYLALNKNFYIHQSLTKEENPKNYQKKGKVCPLRCNGRSRSNKTFGLHKYTFHCLIVGKSLSIFDVVTVRTPLKYDLPARSEQLEHQGGFIASRNPEGIIYKLAQYEEDSHL